jgi:hypothetical protein
MLTDISPGGDCSAIEDERVDAHERKQAETNMRCTTPRRQHCKEEEESFSVQHVTPKHAARCSSIGSLRASRGPEAIRRRIKQQTKAGPRSCHPIPAQTAFLPPCSPSTIWEINHCRLTLLLDVGSLLRVSFVPTRIRRGVLLSRREFLVLRWGAGTRGKCTGGRWRQVRLGGGG